MSDCIHKDVDYDEATQITTCSCCGSFHQLDGEWFPKTPCPCSLCETKRLSVTITKARYQELLAREEVAKAEGLL